MNQKQDCRLPVYLRVALWLLCLFPTLLASAFSPSLDVVQAVVFSHYLDSSQVIPLTTQDPSLLLTAPDGYTQAEFFWGRLPVAAPLDTSLGDGQGISMIIQPGQGLRLWGPTVTIGEGPAILRCTIHATSPNVSIAAAMLDVPPGGTVAQVDGSIGTNQLVNCAEYLSDWRTLELIYDPRQSAVIPLIQAVSISQEVVLVNIDQMVVIPIDRLNSQDLSQVFHKSDGNPFPTPTQPGTIATPTPTPPVSNTNVSPYTISSGFSHVLVIRPSDGLWAWGNNENGQIGDGSTTHRYEFIKTDFSPGWTAVSAGGMHSHGIKSDGTLWSWGLNNHGQLGIGSNLNQQAGVRIGTDGDWAMVSAGLVHSAAIKNNGTLWAWGNNQFWQLGNNTQTSSNIPIQIGPEIVWKAVSSGAVFTLALSADGRLWLWGSITYGNQAGDGGVVSLTPQPMGSDTNWAAISAGASHALFLKTDGTLWGWGYNLEGQLGDGTQTNQPNLIRIGTDSDWTKISAGAAHSHAIKADGSLWGWGDNPTGQLGDGTFILKTTPIHLGTQNNWVWVSAGGYQSIGIKSNGEYWGWGLLATERGQNNSQPIFPKIMVFDPSSVIKR